MGCAASAAATPAQAQRGGDGKARAPAGPAEGGPPFPRNGVRVRWLRAFVEDCRGKTYRWTSRDFLKEEHGGGGTLHVDAEGLGAHRERIAMAARGGDGVSTTVHYENIPFEIMTTENVCFGIVKPATEALGCAYTEKLLKEGSDGVLPATAFVSHAWKYTFVDVVEALLGLPDYTSAWFDVFTVNQHASTNFHASWWYTTFKDAVASIGHTVLVLMPWKDPIPLTRAWCIWEILCTIDAGGAALDVRLPAVEREALVDFLVRNGAESIVEAMLKLDVQRAEAWKDEDRDNILAAVREYSGGASEVNKRVKDQMRSWLTETARTALDGLSGESRALSDLLLSVADLFAEQGKNDEAETLYREALDGRRREFGDAHSKTISTMCNLAIVLKGQGKYDEAEKLYRKALEGKLKSVGDGHPDTLGPKNNLALLLSKQGKHDEAERLLREALEGRQREQGDAHPDTLGTMGNLGVVLYDQRKYDEAERLHREALKGKRRWLGHLNPATLLSAMSLALVVKKLGKNDEAEKLYHEALEGRRRVLGNHHPDTLHSMESLAHVLNAKKRFLEAAKLHREAIEGRRHKLGEEHPDTLGAKASLAISLRGHGEYDEAERLQRDVLAARRRTLGDGHSSTINSMVSLAIVLKCQRKFLEAANLYREAIKAGGAADPDTLDRIEDLAHLAQLLRQEGKHDEAAALDREVPELRKDTCPFISPVPFGGSN